MKKLLSLIIVLAAGCLNSANASWQSYVDDQLVGTGKVKLGAIHSQDGSVWATSAGFTVDPAEVTTLVAAYSDPSAIQASGFYIAGVKYFVIRADDRSIYGKKGATGVAAVKTTQAVVIGTYDETMQPGQCTNEVEKLADYLIENGY